MGLNDTTIARRLAEKPKTGGVPGSAWGAPTQWGTAVWGGVAHGRPVGVQVPVAGSAYVEFPGEANDNLSVPTAAFPADAAADWRVEIRRPATGVGLHWTWGESPLFIRILSSATVQIAIEATDATFPAVAPTIASLVGFPAVGERVQLRGTWDPTTDTITMWWRPVGQEIDDDDDWLLGASAVAAGKQLRANVVTYQIGSASATIVAKDRAHRWYQRINGDLTLDIDCDVDLLGVDPAATSFVCSTGQTVTVNRSGSPTTTLVPTSLDDWYLVIERLDGAGSTWGAPTKWGQARWGTLEWVDITGFVQGIETRRGADEPNGRPRVGEYRLTLDNDSGEFDPWRNYARTRVGAIVRCGLASKTDPRAGGWIPRWCGCVDDWPVEFEGSRVGAAADSWVTVTIVDTFSDVAGVDDNALVSVVGAGDTVVPRVTRLLEAMAWRYGLVTMFDAFEGGEPAYTLQSTDMSANRAAELAAVAESTRSVIRSDVTGACLVTTRDRFRDTRLWEFSRFEIFGVSWGMIALTSLSNPDGKLTLVAYEADSAITGNNRDGIYNRHRWARIGGNMQTFEHRVSMGRFGILTSTRTNLYNTSDADVLEVAQDANDWQARTALRLEAVTVDVTPDVLLAVAAADLDDDIWFFPLHHVGFSGSAFGKIRSIVDQIRPQTDDVVDWQVTFAVDFYQFQDMPGAILDPAPR